MVVSLLNLSDVSMMVVYGESCTGPSKKIESTPDESPSEDKLRITYVVPYESWIPPSEGGVSTSGLRYGCMVDGVVL